MKKFSIAALLLLVLPKNLIGAEIALNEQRNLYFGDTHVHTSLSFDAYLFGSRLGLDDAYLFAQGKKLTLASGEEMQISRPLDFVVMTDHAESFGMFETCGQSELSTTQKTFCASLDKPSKELFLQLRAGGAARPPKPSPLCEGDEKRCDINAKTTWDTIRKAAEKYNQPGEFTAFAGYEYSPPLPKRGKIHRNIIFKNSHTPSRAVSALNTLTALDLWSSLEQDCTDECDFITIPHNMNKSWGIAYSGRTIDDDAYEESDWALRSRNEPLAEIFQIKGSSECGYGLGATDEECNFEIIAPLCENGQESGCSGVNSFARQGLKNGLELEQQLGFNPLRFGFIGSTDSHNSAPGDTEEYDYRGASALLESPAKRRLGPNTKALKKSSSHPRYKNPGGLAAVWAKSNTRDEIFDSLNRRETYATSGTRIQLRFFAGWEYTDAILTKPNLLEASYQQGIPMGSVLEPSSKLPSAKPKLLVWAVKDGLSAPLQKIQLVKSWLENGKAQESVVDIACSDGLAPDSASGRCPDNKATVDINDCSISQDKGNDEIKVVWTDNNFDAKQAAIYYVRVLENPTCRWSTYDANKLGIDPVVGLPQTIQERAWSSPIWYTP